MSLCLAKDLTMGEIVNKFEITSWASKCKSKLSKFQQGGPFKLLISSTKYYISYFRWFKESLQVEWGLKTECSRWNSIPGLRISPGLRFSKKQSLLHIFLEIFLTATTIEIRFLLQAKTTTNKKINCFCDEKASRSFSKATIITRNKRKKQQNRKRKERQTLTSQQLRTRTTPITTRSRSRCTRRRVFGVSNRRRTIFSKLHEICVY